MKRDPLVGICVLACAALLVPYIGHILDSKPEASAQVQALAEAAVAADPEQPGDSAVPIVVYHVVRPALQSDSAAVKKLALTPEVFDQELSYLQKGHYTVIPFSALEDHILKGAALPTYPIVLTFDDGWHDQYEYAFPILKQHGIVATFFIPSNFPGHPSFMSWDELRELIAAGMTVGDHSKSHPDFNTITSTSTLWQEIGISLRSIQIWALRRANLHTPSDLSRPRQFRW